jgi:hypothetical protein
MTALLHVSKRLNARIIAKLAAKYRALVFFVNARRPISGNSANM